MDSDCHSIYKFSLISKFLYLRTWKRSGSQYLLTVQRGYAGRVSGEGSQWKEEEWLSHTAWLLIHKRLMAVWITCVSSWAEAPETQYITEPRARATLWAKQISRSPWPNQYWRVLSKSYMEKNKALSLAANGRNQVGVQNLCLFISSGWNHVSCGMS